ncbi:nucleoside/nucleotide kinase family protein [Actinoplanes sp. NPDC049265]|uniref:nucleoside/nucleotide kinase family protein n=1 Tax=Actinoplanes sp. NPDC049265 TaxID=3363902 RepID=UPI0037119410
MTTQQQTGAGTAAELAARLDRPGHRTMVGIAGPPGSGKSTLAAEIAGILNTAEPGRAVVVPFDGFHLANSVLRERGRAGHKGALDTFDLAGFRALVERLRHNRDEVVYAPAYLREIEEAVAAAIPVPRAARVIVVEGNYLLLTHPDLDAARAALDECWYLDVDGDLRTHRLVERHITAGKTPAQAWAWATGSDEANAAQIRASRPGADLVVRLRHPGNL